MYAGEAVTLRKLAALFLQHSYEYVKRFTFIKRIVPRKVLQSKAVLVFMCEERKQVSGMKTNLVETVP